MGCVQSTNSETDRRDPAKKRSEEIEKQLKKERMEKRSEVKLLFLGAGESGKSTVLKQFRLLYDNPMEEEERLGYREVILANTFQSLAVVLDAMEMMGLPFSDPDNVLEAQAVTDVGSYPEWPVQPSVAKSVVKLYADEGVKKTIARRNQFQLNDSANYFFENVMRTTKSDFVPTDNDILRCRVKTTGISETALQVGQLRYRLLDVGGQRTERRKWLNCFDDVTVLLFLVAIQEFDQSLYEDESVNRLQESLTLFQSVANSRWFANSSIILFLNKIDLFAAKLQAGIQLHKYCKDYDGPNKFEPASQYMCELFRSQYVRNKELYHHFTCATDTKQVGVVLVSVNDTILRKNLQYSGLL